MKIVKGTFKIKEDSDDGSKWKQYEGSYGQNYPFYIHRKEDAKWWNLSHISTGYAIRRGISLKDARELAKTLKEWPIFLMPTVETLIYQKNLLPTYKQEHLRRIIYGE